MTMTLSSVRGVLLCTTTRQVKADFFVLSFLVFCFVQDAENGPDYLKEELDGASRSHGDQ